MENVVIRCPDYLKKSQQQLNLANEEAKVYSRYEIDTTREQSIYSIHWSTRSMACSPVLLEKCMIIRRKTDKFVVWESFESLNVSLKRLTITVFPAFCASPLHYMCFSLERNFLDIFL